jgi:hypothetical protein
MAARLKGGGPFAPFSSIRTVTVGPGVAPGLLTLLPRKEALAGFDLAIVTAGGDFHPALRTRLPEEAAGLL